MEEGALGEGAAKALANIEAKEANGTPINLDDVTVDADELEAINDAITAGDKEAGPFDLTFETPDGTKTTVRVTLKDNGAGDVDPEDPTNDTDRIGGNDFEHKISEGVIDDDKAKDLAEVEATDKDGNPIDLSDITVDPDTLKDLNDAIETGEEGKYPLTFITPDGTEVTVEVTLVDDGETPVTPPVTPPAGAQTIDGDDFFYGLDEGALSGDIAKILANIEAKEADGTPIDLSDIKVDADELLVINNKILLNDKTGGPFDLTFETPDGTKTTVKVILKDNGAGDVDPEDPTNDTDRIGGNDFEHKISEGVIDDDQAKELAEVEATDKDGNPIDLSDITVDPDILKDLNDAIEAGEEGKYPLTFITPDGTEVTVEVTLVDDGEPPVTPSVTPPVTPSVTPTVTPLVTPSVTPTVTPSVTPTVIPSVTPTVIPSVTPTVIPSVTPTVIPSVTPSVTPTVTPLVTPTVYHQ